MSEAMKATRLLPLLLCLSPLAACSGESTPTFSDPIAALDKGDAALAAKDVPTAIAAYEYASQNGDEGQRTEALTGLMTVYVENGDAAAATQAFENLSKHASLSAEALNDLATLCIENSLVEPGNAVVNYAVANNEGGAMAFKTPIAALERLEKEGPDADLSDLGYAGD